MFEVEVMARFDTREQAEAAREGMTEVVGRNDGEIEDATITVEGGTECRCCGAAMEGSDHCPKCGCEEFEERADCSARK